jgi:hypothetical protein
MKKVIIATAISLAAFSAQAWEIGARGVYDWSGPNSSGGGVTIGNTITAGPLGALNVALEATRVGESPNAANQYALVATKPLVALPLKATLGVRAGLAHLEPLGEAKNGGVAGLVGVSLAVPVTKTVSVEGGIDRRFVESSVGMPDGNVGFLGVRVAF